jgi:predicted HTH transcriptional regulator
MIRSVEDIVQMSQRGTLREFRVDNLELKKGWSQEVGKKISALANAMLDDPIWLCVGIDDSGRICGRDDTWARETEETISQHLNQ